jgi:hypothetical protein
VAAVAGAAEGFSFPPPSRNFILASLSPAIVWLLTVGDRLHYILAVMLVIFVPMTLWQGQKRNRMYIQAQQLRFRNEAQTTRGSDLLANAQQAADAMNMLLDTLLDISKLQAGAPACRTDRGA